MKKQTILFILILSTFLVHKIAAQIPAPKLLCIKNDTVIWQPPVVGCGGFNSYLIFASRSLGGPYTQIGTVTNASITKFFHANAGVGTWFYYMQSNYNCPGQTPLNSDTIENALPQIVPIVSLNVVNTSEVLLTWKAITSPNIIGYIIYKKSGNGFIPIDTIVGTSYTDSKAKADTKSEQYQILALNQCGSTSLFDPPNNTILLKGIENACAQKFVIFWNDFKNWSIPVSKYEIWLSFNNKAPLLYATVSSKDTIYEFPNVIDKKNYKFFVRAVQAVTGITAKSNIFEINSNINQPVTDLYLTNVTTDSKNRVELFWIWNDNAKIDSVIICKSTDSINFKSIAGYRPKYPIGDLASYVDTSKINGKAYYQIKTIDVCDTMKSSNIASNIWLIGTLVGGNKNVLNWSPLENIYGRISQYDVYRILDGIASSLPSPNSNTSRTDLIGQDELKICYVVEASYELTLPNGTTDKTTMRSNTICIDQKVNIFVPNAFSPSGLNPEFKPVIGLKENIVAYQMTIYNRYGGKLFFTNDKDEGWNGTINNSIAPEGSYTYYISIVQTSGEAKQFKGNFILIR